MDGRFNTAVVCFTTMVCKIASATGQQMLEAENFAVNIREEHDICRSLIRNLARHFDGDVMRGRVVRELKRRLRVEPELKWNEACLQNGNVERTIGSGASQKWAGTEQGVATTAD